MLGGIVAIAVGLLAPALTAETPSVAPTVLRHRVRSHDTLSEIAALYGVKEEQLREWNGLTKPPKRGSTVEVRARIRPRPRLHRTTYVGKKDTWTSIADRWDVTVEQLRRWNPRMAKRKRLHKGATLSLWLPSGVKRYPMAEDDSAFKTFAVPADALSIGSPSRGRLKNGLQLPKSELYTIRFGWQSFGSSVTIAELQRGLDAFRTETGFGGEIKIGAMSQKHGRRLRPHQSHQSGRDVDVRMPAMSFAEGFTLEQDEIDWPATWAMVDALVRTGAVQVIFLERKLNRKMRRAGMRLGASEERVRKVMRSLRHAKGHTSHVHVRFVCAPTNEECDPAR